MRHMLSRSLRAKSGMATILGMLFFIGVLFTCVIPLFLYVNQVNSFYDQTAMEMRQRDLEHEAERLEIYAFPNSTLDELYVYIRNKCALNVKVVRVWVNDTFCDEGDLPDYLPLVLQGVSEETIRGINISEGYFDILVTTDRGSVFASFTNTIHITEDGWEQGAYNFGIPVFIMGGGQYEVNVTDKAGFTDIVTVKSAPNAYRIIQVPKPGTYYVKVTCGQTTWPVEGEFERSVDWLCPTAQTISILP